MKTKGTERHGTKGGDMRVIVADERREVRSALRILFEQERIELVGDAADAESLLAEVSDHSADVLLLDWELLGSQTSAAISAIRLLAPGLRIVARSGRPEAKGRALADGVDGFVTKAEPPEHVLRAMEKAAGLMAGTARTLGEER
jgi:DNA-binding NarL/FixJ family response regulator